MRFAIQLMPSIYDVKLTTVYVSFRRKIIQRPHGYHYSSLVVGCSKYFIYIQDENNICMYMLEKWERNGTIEMFY